VLPSFVGSLGARFSDPSRIDFYQTQAAARLSDRLVLRGVSHFDARTGVFVENRLSAEVRFQCWSVALSYVNRTESDHGFRVSVGLQGIGQVGTGGRFGLGEQRSAVPSSMWQAVDADPAPPFSDTRGCS
jgi:hypothetical protein